MMQTFNLMEHITSPILNKLINKIYQKHYNVELLNYLYNYFLIKLIHLKLRGLSNC